MANAKDIFKKMEKKYPSEPDVEYVPTKSQIFNKVLGGGVPLGRLIRVWGPSGIGKSHLCLEVTKAFVNEGYKSVFLDFEGGLTPDLWASFGLDEHHGDMFFPHTECHTYEDLVELLISYSKDEEVGLIVVDSMAAVSEKKNADIEDVDEFNKQGIASKARLDSKFYKDYNGVIKKNKITFFQVEQQRNVIENWGSYKKCRGGETAEFYTDVQVRLKQDQTYEENGQIVASDLKIETEKNKTHKLDEGIIPIRYGEGFDSTLMIMQYLQKFEDSLPFFARKGAWYKLYDDEGNEFEKFQGQDELREYVASNTSFFVEELKEAGVVD